MATKEERSEMLQVMVENGNYTKWERDFLDSIIAQLDKGKDLSPAQEEKLLQIQRKD